MDLIPERDSLQAKENNQVNPSSKAKEKTNILKNLPNEIEDIGSINFEPFGTSYLDHGSLSFHYLSSAASLGFEPKYQFRHIPALFVKQSA